MNVVLIIFSSIFLLGMLDKEKYDVTLFTIAFCACIFALVLLNTI